MKKMTATSAPRVFTSDVMRFDEKLAEFAKICAEVSATAKKATQNPNGTNNAMRENIVAQIDVEILSLRNLQIRLQKIGKHP